MTGIGFFSAPGFGAAIILMFNGIAACQDAAASKPGEVDRSMLVVNEDNSHFFFTRNPEDMTLAGLNAWVDQYAGSSVTHLFLCPNAMRASFRSHTRDAIWDPVQGKEPQNIWPRNAKRLFEAGLDPYKIWIARCRKQGISPWHSMLFEFVPFFPRVGNTGYVCADWHSFALELIGLHPCFRRTIMTSAPRGNRHEYHCMIDQAADVAIPLRSRP